MGSLYLRIPDEKHQRLKELAKSKNISVNQLIEELTTIALTEYDIETRFKLRASKGSTEQALEVLEKLKQDFGDEN
ncbi:MAG: toxin-antitoxin system HicB family antitoxin [Xenococcaceae cyanobacterium MO_234.B1]|nr:toxin-antitoxin system HicB family antitoxin [Xenococcaceae cyanobacterium MO_234.B1]